MEIEFLPLCNLCTKPVQNEARLIFSCNHTLCYRCVPYIIYRILETSGLGHTFFNEEITLKCRICNEGQINQVPVDLMKFFEINSIKAPSLKRKSLEMKCESCEENDALFCCLGCSQQKYCRECLKIHQLNKKFAGHKTVGLDEAKQRAENSSLEFIQNCKCALRRKMEFFCQKCQISVCKFCLKNDHEEHKQIPLSEIFDKSKTIEFKLIQKKLSEFIDDFNVFKAKVVQSYDIDVNEQNKIFEEIIDNWIKLLFDIKAENKKNAKCQTLRLQEKLNLILDSLMYINNELDHPFLLHPNKLLMLNSFFSEFSEEARLDFPDFKVKAHQYVNFRKMDELIAFFQKDVNNKFLDLEETSNIKVDKINLMKCYNNFLSDFNDVLNRTPFCIEDKMNDCKWLESNCFRSIILEDDTFLIWPDYDKRKKNAWLSVFNLSLKKSETIIPIGDSIITVVGTYPSKARLDSLKWLYCADDGGIFQIFDLDKSNKFQNILKIQTDMKKGILSVIIFDDIFMEISKSEIDKSCYGLFSLDSEKCPLPIYKLNGKKAGEKVKEIPNIEEKYVCPLTFYYDDLSSKCFLVCSSSNVIKIFDLSMNIWIKTIRAIGDVELTQVIQKYEGGKTTFLIFRHNVNEILFVDLTNQKMISKISSDDKEQINDLCSWNLEKNLFIVASKSSIKLLDVSKKERIGTKLIGAQSPFTFTKVLIKNKTAEKYDEHLALFSGNGREIKIY